VSFAAVTTGTTWIAFMPFPGEGQNYKDGTAIVFPSLESVLADFAKFYDLFAKDSIIQKLYRIIFSKMSGETIFNAEELMSVNSSDDIKFLQKSSMAHDLETVFKEFFGTLSGDSDPEMLVHCFVETKESKSADFALEKIIDNLVSNVTSLKTEPENALADHIQISVEMGLRPHLQEGYLLGEYPEMADYEQKELYFHYEIDFGRRLVAKFRFNPTTFWKNDTFPQVGRRALYPSKVDDDVYRMAIKVRRRIG
jgi:hypothetical protein